MMGERPNVTIIIEFDGAAELTHEEMWPDWDGEAVMTAADIADLVRSDGGLLRVMQDWELQRHLTAKVTVTERKPNPAYGGDDVLFGEAPPAELVTVTEAEVRA